MNTAFQPSGNEVKQAAFSEHRRSGRLNASRTIVMTNLEADGPGTRQQLEARTVLPLASICGRCRELIDLGYIEVVGMSADRPARQVLALTKQGRAAIERAVGGAA
ncbi:MarR family winged helix-turn-helix transcriptional regulator [Vreelandella malpeensis]|uniref:Winged helix-turn-helix transcriptional regulator n=1 Tax=Vreelandella malpeensis TaxID=1172368 RepID=A0ABS8DUE6_9GAMM|nr:MarR family winged helix-turn-helix transcriptional regulator [Halomonas malpeensis]MCB8889952.1 winged helix-turn-helix transcriptional regulator [Halomonas malpeensis]